MNVDFSRSNFHPMPEPNDQHLDQGAFEGRRSSVAYCYVITFFASLVALPIIQIASFALEWHSDVEYSGFYADHDLRSFTIPTSRDLVLISGSHEPLG